MIKSFIKDYKRFFNLLQERKRKYVTTTLFASFSWAISILLDSYAIKTIIDFFINNDDTLLIRTVIIVLLKILVDGLLNPFTMNIVQKQQGLIMRDIKKRAFSHLQQLPISYFSDKHSSDVMVKVNSDIDSLNVALMSFHRFMTFVISMAFTIPYFIYLDLRLFAISVVMGLIFLIVTVKSLNPLRESNNKIRDEISNMSETVTENVSGFNVVRMFNLEGVFKSRLSNNLDELYQQQKKYSHLKGILGFAGIFIWRAGSTAIASLGAWFAMNKTLEIGVLVGAVRITSSLIHMIIEMGQLPADLQKSFTGTDRLYELFDTDVEPYTYNTVEGNNAHAAIALENISFSYNSDQNVINDLSLQIKTNQTVALVGDSGGGKSTLIRILLGLYPVQKGEISIDGKGLNKYSLEELRTKMAYVPQNAYIFNGTIKENIAYGNIDASEKDIVDAAKKANAHDFIKLKLNGYDSVVGERGIKLSGGERQRIAIARAIVKNAPFLLLDEATSSLDNESEKLVQNALDKLLVNRTSVIVAHRLSTILHADVIYYVKDGKIVEQGNHSELLIEKGYYAELYYREFV